jgi:hypothetical protein
MIEELVPVGHWVHSLKSKAPPYPTYVPIGQFAHSVPLAYLPAAQGVHAVPSAPVYPARHLHDTRVPLPATENVLPGHARQVELVEAPTVVEYLPAMHAVHSDDPITSANVPAGHGVPGVVTVCPVAIAIQIKNCAKIAYARDGA